MATFPTTLRGVKINVRRTQTWATKIQTSSGGYENRTALQSSPRRAYEIDIEFLSTSYPTGIGNNEMYLVTNFIEVHKGSLSSFHFTDPYDGSSVHCRFADGDAVTVERLFNGYWGIRSLKFIEVKGENPAP